LTEAVTETPTEAVTRLSGEISALDRQIESCEQQISDKPPVEKPGLFDVGSDAKLTEDLSKIYDRVEAREERTPEFPSREGERLEDRIERAHEWGEMSKAKREQEAGAAAGAQEIKDLAAKYGLTPEQSLAIQNNEILRQGAQFAPGAEHMRAVFKDTDPVESAAFFRKSTEAFRQDPIGTLVHFGGQAGMHPLQLAAAIQQRFQSQPQATQRDAYMQALGAEINRVSDTLPDLDNHGDEIVSIIEGMNRSGKRSNDPIKDLRAAYKEAVRRDAKLTPDQRTHKSMSRTYDRLNPK